MRFEKLCLVTLLASLTFSSPVLLAKGSTDSGSRTHAGNGHWLLEQSSDQYGFISTQIKPNGIFMRTSDMRVFVSIPNPKLTIVSDETKRYVQRPMDVYDLVPEPAGDPERFILLSSTPVQISGFKATKYVFKSNLRHYQVEFWTTQALGMSPQLTQACSWFVGCGKLKEPGLPLRLVVHNANGSKFTYLDTKSIKTDSAKIDFKLPDGYKKVASALELIAPDDIAGDTRMPAPLKQSDARRKKASQQQ
jgi:hypothetical protein